MMSFLYKENHALIVKLTLLYLMYINIRYETYAYP